MYEIVRTTMLHGSGCEQLTALYVNLQEQIDVLYELVQNKIVTQELKDWIQ